MDHKKHFMAVHVPGIALLLTWICVTCVAAAQIEAPPPAATQPDNPGELGIASASAKDDAAPDQTAALQSYVDQVARRGGGQATLPPGKYVLRGSLRIPTGVTLTGAWEIPHHGILSRGTVLLVYAGREKEDGPAAIELQQSSGIKGVTICYPQQTLPDPRPYPWAIHGRGMHNTVENVTLVNAWQGIAIGPEHNELHLIRNVYGCVLRRGVFIDNTTDIGRIENVHFNPHYWPRSGHDGVPNDTVAVFMQQNLEAFIFGRTDWQSVRDTFVFGARIGYHFIGTSHGDCNGQLAGIGADACQYCVVVDKAQPQGLLISNGQFVCLSLGQKIEPRIGVVTSKQCGAAVQLTNCSFWGNFTNCIRAEGSGLVSISQARMEGYEAAPVEILGGRGIVRDVLFASPASQHVRIGKDVRRAVVEANMAEGGVKIGNEADKRLTARDNEE